MAEIKLRKRYYSGVQIVDALCVSCCDYQTQMKVLNNLASADCDDVVKVVRCKDCKYFEEIMTARYRDGTTKEVQICKKRVPLKDENFHCEWGERK